MSDAPNPLELVDTDDLIEELHRRNSVLVVIAQHNPSPGKESIRAWFRGGFSAALGAARMFVVDLESQHADDMRALRKSKDND